MPHMLIEGVPKRSLVGKMSLLGGVVVMTFLDMRSISPLKFDCQCILGQKMSCKGLL